MENYNDTSLHCSLVDITEEVTSKTRQEFDEYVEILNTPIDERRRRDVDKLATKLSGLGVFDRTLLENMDSKTVLRKLVSYLKYEFFPAGNPIFHYEQPADKFYIVLRGKAREFDAKNLKTIEKESRSQYRADPLPRDVAVSLQEFPNNPTLASLNTLQEGQIQSLVTIDEDPIIERKELRSPTELAKKFRKMKAFFPFLKQMVAQKTATQRINDYSYKQSLRKARSLQKSFDNSSIVSPDAIDNEILEEFKKYPKAYFIGGVLKVKFSRYIDAGGYCGLRALQDNALRTKAVIAEEDCHCISLHKDDFFNVLEEEKALNVDKIDFFRKIFSKFEETRVIKFALGWEDQTVKMSDQIFQQNESSDSLYALFRGEIILSKTAPMLKKQQIEQELPFRIKKKQDQPEAMKVATLCAGDFFGDFFQGDRREFTATVSSARAKIFRLPLKKYQENYRGFFDLYREIKTITGLKLKWNKERFEGLSQQNLAQNLMQSRNLQSPIPCPDKEKALKDIGHYFASSLTNLSSGVGWNEKLASSIQELGQTVQTQQDSKVWVRDEGVSLGSPKSCSRFDNEDKPTKALLRVTGGAENPNILINKVENKPKGPTITVGEENSILLFSRARVPREYTPRQNEMLKKQKEASPDVFVPKRLNIKRKTEVISSKPANTTRYASIELLKKRVIEKKPRQITEPKSICQTVPSIDLDVKLNSPVYTQPGSLVINQADCSSTDRTLQITLRGQSVDNKQRKTKPMSIEKLNLLCIENPNASEPKKKLVQKGEQSLRTRTLSNCSISGYLQTGFMFSVKSPQEEVVAKSLTNIQMLSPKGSKNDAGKESSKGFRVKTNTELFKLSMDGRKRPATGIKRGGAS